MNGVRGSVYMHWAKQHAAARYNLANSGLLGCEAADLEPAPSEIPLNGPNGSGFQPLLEAIAERYGAAPEQVVQAGGTSGANFLAFATLVEPGDEVLVEQPTYEPLLAALTWLGARPRRFQRRFEDGYGLDPDAVRAQLDAATAAGGRVRLVVLTNPHNPSGALAPAAAVAEIGRLAERAGALVLVDEVYKDLWGAEAPPSHLGLGPNLLATASLTKCYGLSGLRCGWVLAPAALAERMRRVFDFMAANRSMPSDALALAAFRQLPRLAARANSIVDPNRQLVRDFLAEHGDWLEAVLPEHSMMVFPRLLREDDSQPLHDRLRRRETSIVPGRFFEAPRHFRLGFAVRTDDVAAGLRHLSQALREA
jgi:aspartate/methionine/tyrosine aminotransferase